MTKSYLVIMVKLAGIVLVFYLAAFVETMPQQQEQQLSVAATAPINSKSQNAKIILLYFVILTQLVWPTRRRSVNEVTPTVC